MDHPYYERSAMLKHDDYSEAVRRFKNKRDNPHARQRYHALLLVTKGYSYRQTADILFVDEETISQWVRRYQQHGLDGLKNHPQWGGEHGQNIQNRNPALEPALEQMLDNEMAGNPMSEQRWVRI